MSRHADVRGEETQKARADYTARVTEGVPLLVGRKASGLVRWLRPGYQNPGGVQAQQGALAVGEARDGKHGKSGKKMVKLAWPKTMAERVMAVSGALAGVREAVTAADVARGFSRAKAADVGEILETLCAVGRAHKGKVAGTFLP